MQKSHRQVCFNCRRPQSSCMCSFTFKRESLSNFIILTHPKEYKKIKNGTGRLSYLQLKNCEIIVDIDFSLNKKLNKLIEKYDCYILYPSTNALNLDDSTSVKKLKNEKQKCFIILDATWPCAKKMIKLSKNLQNLPAITFNSDMRSEFKIKQQPHEKCLSTIESIKVLIDKLNDIGLENVNTSDFLLPFNKMIEYQIECTLREDNKHYRKNTAGHLNIKKEKYKTNSSYKIFY